MLLSNLFDESSWLDLADPAAVGTGRKHWLAATQFETLRKELEDLRETLSDRATDPLPARRTAPCDPAGPRQGLAGCRSG